MPIAAPAVRPMPVTTDAQIQRDKTILDDIIESDEAPQNVLRAAESENDLSAAASELVVALDELRAELRRTSA